MKHFFILGNNPTMSFIEIKAVLSLKPADILFFSEEILIVDINYDLDLQIMINKLGGTIKIGVIYNELPTRDVKQGVAGYEIATAEIFKLINTDKINGKFNFGFSYYGAGKIDERKLAMEIKEALKEKDFSSRWVSSREKQLSSVVVEQNKLLGDKGLEVVIIKNQNSYYIGTTSVVQPFKELSKRDYGRPGRDDYSGMIPPKLAKMMINFTSKKPEGVLLDPFCGSGTILTEAMLMGYKNLVGTDKSEKAVKDTRQNIIWIKDKCKVAGVKSQISQSDVRQLLKTLKPNSINLIVTEPYLGPPRMKRDKYSIQKVVTELEQLYHEAILQFDKILKNNGKVTMVWPVFMIENNEPVFLNTKNILKNSSFQKTDSLFGFKNKVLKLTDRRTLLYKREGQKVAREIVTLQKQ